MKLRNKKTGEIGNLALNINPNRESYSVLSTENGNTICGNLVIADYNSLAELNEEWEDCDEAEYYYAITSIKLDGGITKMKNIHNDMTAFDKSIGNYFETREEAEQALEKLKAWKRLKDAGVSFKPTTIGHKWYLEPHASPENRTFKESQDLYKDVMLLFGVEYDKK